MAEPKDTKDSVPSTNLQGALDAEKEKRFAAEANLRFKSIEDTMARLSTNIDKMNSTINNIPQQLQQATPQPQAQTQQAAPQQGSSEIIGALGGKFDEMSKVLNYMTERIDSMEQREVYSKFQESVSSHLKNEDFKDLSGIDQELVLKKAEQVINFAQQNGESISIKEALKRVDDERKLFSGVKEDKKEEPEKGGENEKDSKSSEKSKESGKESDDKNEKEDSKEAATAEAKAENDTISEEQAKEEFDKASKHVQEMLYESDTTTVMEPS